MKTFNDTSLAGKYKRVGLEIAIRKRYRIRVGWWISGHMPTLFYAGHLEYYPEMQLRIWRLAVSYTYDPN